ncbi:MAG: HD-GYP domain-containing protein [Gemmatimonadaceae bacterium]|nr:HD-GYP domain-containing protein [Gemmatimonadaceae bacterium]
MQNSNQRLKPRPWSRLTERVEPAPTTRGSSIKATPVVVAIAAAAVAAFYAVFSVVGVRTESAILLGLTLAVVGVLADFMSFYAQGRSVVGSIALIPLSSAVLLVPDYRGLSLVVAAQVITEIVKKRPPLKFVFNVAQVTLGFGVGALLFHRLGGRPFGVLESGSFFEAAAANLGPASLLVASVMLVNTMSVSAVVSVVTGQPFLRTWVDGNKSTAVFFFFHVFLTFYLAWLTQNLGLLGSVGMAVPLVAVRQLLRTTAELTGVTEELLDLMVAAIEARDPYTSGHSRRVSESSRVIAKALGLGAAEVERVEVAALLHDVGKIDEQFARILTKEGRLSPDEWELMKRHPVRGAELVGLLSSLKDIVPSVRHHHENWDGTGYPDGIRGENIPLASRIIMFADTLDAITTDRPYRKALEAEEARREFVKFRGKQFDPAICDVVVSPKAWAELFESVQASRSAAAIVGSTTAESAVA